MNQNTLHENTSWLSSHAAGKLKAHAMTDDQAKFWEAILSVTNAVTAARPIIERIGTVDAGDMKTIAAAEKWLAR